MLNMNKNFKLFIQSICFSSILFSVFNIFIIGFLFRLLINNSYDMINVLEPLTVSLGIISFNGYSYFMGDLSKDKFFLKNTSSIDVITNDSMSRDNLTFKDKCRRKSHWVALGQFESKYSSYENFKEQWKADSKLINQMKDKYTEKKRELIVFKKTLLWFINRRRG